MNAAQRAECITQEKRRDDAQEIAYERHIRSKEHLIENGIEPGESFNIVSEVEARADAIAKLIGKPNLADRLQQSAAIGDWLDIGVIVGPWMKHGY